MTPSDLLSLIEETADFLRHHGVEEVDAGIILGSGLGGIESIVNVRETIPYTDVPHLAGAAVLSHRGHILYGDCGGKRVLVFSGRIHYYEGHEMWQVAYPVRIINALGAKCCISTAAAGGLNADYKEGDIVAISDQINLLPANPLRGPNDDRLGPRFPDMSEPYDQRLRGQFQKACETLGIRTHQGVYASLAGPSLETKAEYIFLHRIGADLVGMSVVPEAIVAAHAGIPFLAVSVVSNICYPPELVEVTTAEKVVEAVSDSAGTVASALEKFITSLKLKQG